MTTLQELDHCGGSLEKALLRLPDLGNEVFVDFVRKSRKEEPDWWNFTAWVESVDREIRMRLLLRGFDDGQDFAAKLAK